LQQGLKGLSLSGWFWYKIWPSGLFWKPGRRAYIVVNGNITRTASCMHTISTLGK